MKIDSEAHDHYLEKGWTVVEEIFDPAEVERIAGIALEVSQELLGSDENYNVDISDDGSQHAPRKIDEPFWMEKAFQEFVLDERLVGAPESLIGREPLLLPDQVFMKPPHFGSAKPYHQDNSYFLCHPADQFITAWIALDDVDEENGCLRYIDGSHKGGILPHELIPGESYNQMPPPEMIDLEKESLALVRQGGVVFHHCQTLHTSHRNESDRWRRAYATHWASAEVTSENDTIPGAYFNEKGYPE